MPFKLAFVTVGILREPVGHEQVQGFLDRVSGVYQSADLSDGFAGAVDTGYGYVSAFMG